MRRYLVHALVYFFVLLIATAVASAGSAAPPTRSAGPKAGARSFTAPPAANCAITSTRFIPLMDLGTGTYHGYEGGLYAGGVDTPPPAYLQAGLTRAKAIRPRLGDGTPDPNGRLVLLSIGMSNTTMEFSQF